MPDGKISTNDQVRSQLLTILVESRIDRNLLLDKYNLDQNSASDYYNKKSSNSVILLWEIICFIAEGNFSDNNTSVSDIYLSLDVSKSTAIRCVGQLESLEILQKSRDPDDRRRAVITLTDKFRADFTAYIDTMIFRIDQIRNARD